MAQEISIQPQIISVLEELHYWWRIAELTVKIVTPGQWFIVQNFAYCLSVFLSLVYSLGRSFSLRLIIGTRKFLAVVHFTVVQLHALLTTAENMVRKANLGKR